MSGAPSPALPAAGWYVGLMSGTSLDGVDGVLAEVSATGCAVAQHAAVPLDSELRAELLSLNARYGADELHRAALAANALMHAYARVVHELLARTGLAASDVQAIGAHGQTVRHQPQMHGGTGYTLQLCNPALLAERTGIAVVADFRSRDVAAGGQGAPLVPAFHRCVFGQTARATGVLNLGGIANLSVLRADGATLGFDCGPANALLDYWCQQHQPGRLYDEDGAWAASGTVLPDLLQALLAEPFLSLPPPRSTGRDLFNSPWLLQRLQDGGALQARPQDVQATLAEFTAHACAQDMLNHAAEARLLIVCGGGALNGHLMQRLQALLPGVRVESSARHGLPPLQVEAAAFAWLARQCMHGQPGNLPAVTGARGPRILGAIYPA
ncbi:anhydro-N-acetylmuramic acid kinase [Pulveribacter sp.]|uniref:anhydro-N-acetylmuramic acid kinase n=1 Tax=Pulveribacter sp. TaxID=2678893 RepID=UPI0028AE1EDC|nr:anhydro-N-acetylmuramic acid kinase [Pulveribacter sp.]